MDLGKNGIGLKGITQLFEVLKNNDTVQTLLLEINNIGDQGAELIAKHLAGTLAMFYKGMLWVAFRSES